jgi:hypothetical protein
MQKKFIIFLIIILGLTIFQSDVCLAKLMTPINPRVPTIGEGSAILEWDWLENGGTLKQFKILYKDKSLSVWTAKYPGYAVGTITYSLMGLQESTTYQWRIKAEAENPMNDSDFIEGSEFTTIQADTPPPEENGNGTPGPIDLRNPLDQDNLWDAINALIDFFVVLAFAIAPVLIIYSAFLMILSHGDATKINKGKSIILWTLVALAVVLFAKGLPSIVKGMFSG